MKKYLFLIAVISSLFGNESQEKMERYLEFLERHKVGLGNYTQGEIEIVTDPKLIQEIQETEKSNLQKKGMSERQAISCAEVGILAEDAGWILLRDAVIFPTGDYGVYKRLLFKKFLTDSENVVGGAILPMLSDGKIVLILTYRHATREWELEIPRGHRHANEAIEKTVMRELKEETGFTISEVTPLGAMTVCTSITNATAPVFFGIVSEKEPSDCNVDEAILRTETFTLAELRKALYKGFATLEMNGKLQEVRLRDPFLTFALFQAESMGLLP